MGFKNIFIHTIKFRSINSLNRRTKVFFSLLF